MADLSWVSQEAQSIHSIFMSVFYGLVTTLLLLGLVFEYFKWPLGAIPSFLPLVGRVLVAAILLYSYTDITNSFASVTDSLASRLGDLNQINLVLYRMGEKLHSLTWSWVSVKDSVTFILAIGSFFLLYFSVHVSNALILYTWALLYIFSPLLIALYVLPATAGATKALYRSLIEVSAWKITWSVLATLIWSSALSQINQSNHDISFLSSICFNLILAGTLMLTPVVVHALSTSGLSMLATQFGVSMMNIRRPVDVINTATEASQSTYNFSKKAHKNYFSKPSEAPKS